ncbi:hypothetical protein JCM17961_33140 [Endothiovibrio diazotrophicus]
MVLGVALAASGSLAQSQGYDVYFNDATGYGVSDHVINIENIRVDFVLSFAGSRPQIVSANYTIPFRFDEQTLHLVPDLGASVDEGTSSASRCASLTLNISDAYTGNPVSDAEVSIGSNSTTSSSDGEASFSNLLEGSIHVGVTATGYSDTEQVVTVSCDEPTSVGVALNPTDTSSGGLATNEVRVILSWGENPRDLDSHLTGPDENSDGTASDETNRFHLYYGNRSSCCDVANLDVDDTTSYGPETVTIRPPTDAGILRAGLYRYSVFHYSGSSDLSTANATVRLVYGDGSERSFSPPSDNSTLSGGYGDVWTVFELMVDSQGAVTVLPVNTYTSASSSGSVRGTNTGYGEVESGVDFLRLPAK